MLGKKLTKLFLRLAIAVGFLSAVADRFGLWHQHMVWGSWDKFVRYTHQLLPWLSLNVVQILAGVATAAEIILAIFLLMGWKLRLFANLSGILMLIFALTMSLNGGIKTAFDASVFTAAAAAFALACVKVKFLEIQK